MKPSLWLSPACWAAALLAVVAISGCVVDGAELDDLLEEEAPFADGKGEAEPIESGLWAGMEPQESPDMALRSMAVVPDYATANDSHAADGDRENPDPTPWWLPTSNPDPTPWTGDGYHASDPDPDPWY